MLISKRKFNVRSLWLAMDGDVAGGGGGDASGGASGDGGATSNVGSGVDGGVANAASVEVDLNAVAAQAAADAARPTVEWEKVVPEEYRDKPYMQNLLKGEDPGKQLFQEMDNLQKRLGERPAGIPKDDAPPEEWDKFYKAAGRPDSPDGYEVPKSEWSAEDKGIGEFIDSFKGNGEFEKDVKQMMFEEGLTKKQAENIIRRYDPIVVKNNRQFFNDAAAAHQQIETDYVATMKSAFGDRAAKVEEIGAKIVKEHTPAALKPLLNQLDPKGLTILSAVMDSINTKYIKEDGRTGGDVAVGGDAKSVREEGIKLMSQPAYKDPMHPNHESIKRQVKDLYATLKV
jgi:hypothetical protein